MAGKTRGYGGRMIWCGLNAVSSKWAGNLGGREITWNIALKSKAKQNQASRAFSPVSEQEVIDISTASFHSLNDFL